MNNNQTQNELKRIKAKQTLRLPLTERENALLILYGQPESDTTPDAAPAPARRLILYRAKRHNDGKWVYGLPRNDSFAAGVITALDTPDGKIHLIDIETLGEFTGLTDKNDIKVFEGDIVKIDGKYIRHVAYSGEHTAFCAMHYIDRQQSELTGTLGDGYDNYKRQYEVVGNIYDNPELLEARK